MISAIEVRDFVNISYAELQLPARGFCALTGETGVGKSMLIGAVSLALGVKAKRNQIKAGCDKAEVTLMFDIKERSQSKQWLAEHGFEVSDELALKRVIDSGGRSRAYINGSRTTLNLVSELLGELVGICGQNEHLKLRDASRRRELLDAASSAQQFSIDTESFFSVWQKSNATLKKQIESDEKSQLRATEIREAINEIEAIDFSAQKWQDYNEHLDLQANTEEINEMYNAINTAIDEITSGVSQGSSEADKLALLLPASMSIKNDMATIKELATDMKRDCTKLNESISNFDQNSFEQAQNFVAEAHRIARKHRLASADLLTNFYTDLQDELEKLNVKDISFYEQEEQEALKKWHNIATKLSKARTKGASKLQQEVQATLQQLGMPKAKFAIEFVKLDKPAKYGLEDVSFKFAARDKSKLGEVGEVASGGELSRLTLALFSHAGGDGSRAMLFDEIDTGIGGKTASYVGSLLAQLGKEKLVLSVTHLPQVAAAASCHWLVNADDDGNASFTTIKGKEREEEIARMLAGRKITQASRENAKEILAMATS